jgi:hypothetical protein
VVHEHPLVRIDRRVQDHGRARPEQRQRLVDREEGPPQVDGDRFIEELFGDLVERNEFADAGVDEEGVDPLEALPDRAHGAVDLGEA